MWEKVDTWDSKKYESSLSMKSTCSIWSNRNIILSKDLARSAASHGRRKGFVSVSSASNEQYETLVGFIYISIRKTVCQ